MSPSPEVLAYVAGLWDGEGHIGIARCRRRSGNVGYMLTIRIKMCDRGPIDFIASVWGGEVHERRRGAWRNAYDWLAPPRVAAAFLADIRPYMKSERNRERAALAIEFQAQKTTGGTVSIAYREQQAAYYARMRELNRRGHVVDLEPVGVRPELGDLQLFEEEAKAA